MKPAADGSWTAVVSVPAGRDVPWRATASTDVGRIVSAAATLRYDCPSGG